MVPIFRGYNFESTDRRGGCQHSTKHKAVKKLVFSRPWARKVKLTQTSKIKKGSRKSCPLFWKDPCGDCSREGGEGTATRHYSHGVYNMQPMYLYPVQPPKYGRVKFSGLRKRAYAPSPVLEAWHKGSSSCGRPHTEPRGSHPQVCQAKTK